MSKPALGRGLGALLGGTPVISNAASAPASPSSITHFLPPPAAAHAIAPALTPAPSPRDQVRHLAVTQIRPCAFQPRQDFSAESLCELADSIREQGIVQPLIVRAQGSHFELIAGERRWRAAQLAGRTEVPVLVREADDRAVLEMALIENLQRENLNPIEEALGYAQLVSQFQLTQDLVATKVGKSRTVVANALRLLKLPPDLQTFLREGRLSVGHAKVILGLPEEAQQRLAAERVIKEALNVRQTEGLIAKLQSRDRDPGRSGGKTPLATDAHVASLENKIRERLGTKVHLRYTKGKGSLDVAFYSDAELERILQILGVSAE